MDSKGSSTKRLVSASALMAAGTLVSRALGLIRVMLIVFILGNGTRQADILTLATMVPSSLYALFAGGALNTVLVPQIVQAIRNDDDGGEAYTNRIMTAFMLIIGAVAALVTLAAPLVTVLYSSDAWRAPELADQYGSMVALTYLTLPQIFFYGVFFLLGQVLNANDQFGPMMWAPIANNVISIGVLSIYLWVWGNQQDHSLAFTTEQIWLLGLGSTIGIVIQSLVMLPYLKHVGFKLRPRFDLRGTNLGKTFSLTKWTIGFVALNQIALVIVNRLASSATASGSGAGVNVYSNSYLIWILPHSLITVSLATAMLPSASRLAAAGKLSEVAEEATRTMRLALVALVPAAIGFMALANPIAGLFFGHGTGSAEAKLVAWTLAAFAIGLIPFTIQFVCLRIYYALEDTRTPFLMQLVIAGTNALGAMAFVALVGDPNLVAAALAMSYSVAYLIGVVLSWRVLKGKLPDLSGRDIVMHVLRLLLGASAGGMVAYILWLLISAWLPGSILGDLLSIFLGLAAITGCYVAVAKVLKVRELRNLGDLVRARLGRGDSSENAAEKTSEIFLRADPSLLEDLMPTQLNPVITDLPLYDEIFGDFEDSDLGEPEEPEEVIQPMSRHSAIGSPGMLISTRFRVDELLAMRNGVETWRAHDLVLSRDVTAHLMRRADPRISTVLAAARKGAVATDSRFLRVLDAVAIQDPHDELGGYVVNEYAPGKSLTDLLISGPLSGTEAAWIVRELADALAAMHGQGLFHGKLTPENVIITESGAVRLVGFGMESVLDEDQEFNSWSQKESADVQGLAKLLYAALVQAWPGEAAFGLTEAPLVGDEIAAPHQIQAGVSPALDRLCSATLTRHGTNAALRITSASQLALQLGSYLGTANASSDLEYRVRQLAGPDTEEFWPTAFSSTSRVNPLISNSPVAPPAPTEAVTASSPDSPEERFPITKQRQAERPRTALWLLLVVAVLALVVSLILVGLQNARDNAATSTPSSSSSSAESSSTPADTGPIEIVAVKDFDPEQDGGDAAENPDIVEQAIDGDLSTGWSTLRYHNRPDLGGLKPGVGLVVDLGEARDVSEFKVIFENSGTNVELRVPVEKGLSEAPMDSESQWRTVASVESAATDTVFTLEEPVDSRFWLVYLTNLPEVSEARFRTTINEIEFP